MRQDEETLQELRGNCVAYWIKITFERNTYVIDLDRVAAFCQMSNRRVAFSIPNGDVQVVVHQQSDPEAYQILLDFIEKRSGYLLDGRE